MTAKTVYDNGISFALREAEVALTTVSDAVDGDASPQDVLYLIETVRDGLSRLEIRVKAARDALASASPPTD